MRARNARLNNNGGWCVKSLENYAVKNEKYHLPSEYLGRYRCRWTCSLHVITTGNDFEWYIFNNYSPSALDMR